MDVTESSAYAEAYLAVPNPSSKNNLGTLIRCAAAFAVEEVVIVGVSKWSTHGAHGSHKHVRYRCFDDWTSAAAYLRIEKQCDLCGIVSTSLKVSGRRRIREDCIKNSSNTICWDDKIHTYDSSSTGLGGVSTSVEKKEESNVAPVDLDSTQQGIQSSEELTSFHPIAVRHRPFRRSTAFIVGHRNHLVEEELAVCDFLVYVEQARESPMELGLPVTISIALHHFTAWAQHEERPFSGEKFDVGSCTQYRPTTPHVKDGLAVIRPREQRKQRQSASGSSARAEDCRDNNTDFEPSTPRWLTDSGNEDQFPEGDY